MNVVDSMFVANALNQYCQDLNRINEQYPRSCGTMVMVSPDQEDRIEDLLNHMEEASSKLEGLTDSEIEMFTDDVDGYREFLSRVRNVIEANRIEVARARDLMVRYHAC